MRVLINAAALGVALLAPNAAAQTQTACEDANRVIHAQATDKGSLDALLALSRFLPAACTREQSTLQSIIEAAQATPDWVQVDPDGGSHPVEPPREPEWAANLETWPRMLRDSDMLAAPTQAQIDARHPPRARERARIGAVTLEGRILTDGTIAWRPPRALPHGWGFEAAALRIASLYRAPLTFPDGRTTVGTTFRTVISFTRPPAQTILYD